MMNNFLHGVNFKEQLQHSVQGMKFTEAQLADFERYAKSITPEWMIEPTNPFSYNNKQTLSSCPELVQVQKSSIQQGQHVSVIHFLGMCHYCHEEPTEAFPLKRCAKCQIVAYCERDCQNKDWPSHKVFCKVFPLRIGTDMVRYHRPVKVGLGSHMRLILDLLERSYRLVLIRNATKEITLGIDQLFRSCRYPGCDVTDESELHCCKCLEVSYCSKYHEKEDTEHQSVCSKSYIRMNSYTRNNSTLSIPYMSAYPGSSKEYKPLRGGKSMISENILSEITEAVVTTKAIADEKTTETQVEVLRDRLAMPFTILYCLQKLGVGQLSTPLAEIKSLNIHIMSALPLFDPQMWELLLHRLPALKELKITYVGNAGLNWHPNNVLNTQIKFERCKDCAENDRSVSIEVLTAHYHMYFSSDDYEEPDVVAIFGYNKKLLDTKRIDKEDVNEITSLRNITYNKDALVILTDYDSIFLENAISEISNARPINTLMNITENPLKAEGHFYSMKRHGKRYNLIQYLTCVQRK